jgi:hypothetical protein
MRGYTTKETETAKIIAGAIAALVIAGWLVVLAIALMSHDKTSALWSRLLGVTGTERALRATADLPS